MKRQLLTNTKVKAISSGDVVARVGYLSAVLGANIAADGTLTATITHSADGETFDAVTDQRVFVDRITENGTLELEVKKDELVNVDIDLLGLKNYIKLDVTGSDSLAIALGDSNVDLSLI